MARNDPQMNLRVPMELKEKIEKAALENGRTITAEAVHRLEKSFEIENTSTPNTQNYQMLIAETMNQLIKSLVKSGVDPKTLVDAMDDLAKK